jgi:putative acetyltransferase
MIRSYRPSDLDDLLGVWAAASVVAHPFLSAEFLRQERRRIPEVYLPNAETWVWEAEGRVVGFVSLLGHEVGALFVHPARHRTGIGRALMDRARAVRGELEVEVFKANLLGRAFYAAYGFELLAVSLHGETGCELLRLRLPANRDG